MEKESKDTLVIAKAVDLEEDEALEIEWCSTIPAQQ